jgi:hypothetical protein
MRLQLQSLKDDLKYTIQDEIRQEKNDLKNKFNDEKEKKRSDFQSIKSKELNYYNNQLETLSVQLNEKLQSKRRHFSQEIKDFQKQQSEKLKELKFLHNEQMMKINLEYQESMKKLSEKYNRERENVERKFLLEKEGKLNDQNNNGKKPKDTSLYSSDSDDDEDLDDKNPTDRDDERDDDDEEESYQKKKSSFEPVSQRQRNPPLPEPFPQFRSSQTSLPPSPNKRQPPSPMKPPPSPSTRNNFTNKIGSPVKPERKPPTKLLSKKKSNEKKIMKLKTKLERLEIKYATQLSYENQQKLLKLKEDKQFQQTEIIQNEIKLKEKEIFQLETQLMKGSLSKESNSIQEYHSREEKELTHKTALLNSEINSLILEKETVTTKLKAEKSKKDSAHKENDLLLQDIRTIQNSVLNFQKDFQEKESFHEKQMEILQEKYEKTLKEIQFSLKQEEKDISDLTIHYEKELFKEMEVQHEQELAKLNDNVNHFFSLSIIFDFKYFLFFFP